MGRNKVAPTFDQALWRARNVAAPLNARRLHRKTPCAQGEALRRYDCKSPERICNGLSVSGGPWAGRGKPWSSWWTRTWAIDASTGAGFSPGPVFFSSGPSLPLGPRCGILEKTSKEDDTLWKSAPPPRPTWRPSPP